MGPGIERDHRTKLNWKRKGRIENMTEKYVTSADCSESRDPGPELERIDGSQDLERSKLS